MPTPPPRNLTHDELVVWFRTGDDAAFTVIHRRFYVALTAFARQMLGDLASEAEDVVQDALLRAYVGLRATSAPIALRPWLYAVVRNRALDELRASRRTGVLDDADHVPAPTSCDPAECIAEAEQVRRIVAAITRLPERQRTALVMRTVDGRSHVQTARAMHTSVPATKGLVNRARAGLQSAMLAA